MKKASMRRALVALLATSMLAGPAFAGRPDWAGGGKGQHGGKHDDDHGGGHGGGQGGERRDPRVGRYFDQRDREAVHVYYEREYGGGRKCPPGLAKKNNGCLPPGQAKKYMVGQPLPADVVYYPVPQPVAVQLPPVPTGYRYVQVASDILLIAVGSSMVVDAMGDLLR